MASGVHVVFRSAVQLGRGGVLSTRDVPTSLQERAKLEVKVNSITSIETELPFSYYSLPFCKPKEGIQKMGENIGELLMGDQIENSPYKFSMKEDQEDVKVCVAPPLSESDVNHFNRRIDDYYQVNMILDNLPVSRYTRQKDSSNLLRWTGSPIGFKLDSDKQHYMYNHLKFKVLVHAYDKDAGSGAVLGTGEGLDVMPSATTQDLTGTFMVVGFEVVPCSVVRDVKVAKELEDGNGQLPISDCDPEKPHQAVKKGEEIVYSYSVHTLEDEVNQAELHVFSAQCSTFNERVDPVGMSF